MSQLIRTINRPMTTAVGSDDESSTAASNTTRRLLACGVVAGPLFVVVALGQALTRPGFDLTRHAVSLLSNGSLGWIQITNFLLTGLLIIAFAAGLVEAASGGPDGSLILFVGVASAMIWVALTAARLIAEQTAASTPEFPSHCSGTWTY